MLATPTLVNQLAAGGSFPHADCGEACLRSVLVDAGHDDAVSQVEAAIAGSGLASGTTTVQMAAACTKLGVPAQAIAAVAECDAALARKHRIIVEIPSDHYGNPTPGSALGHFIEVFGFDGTNYHFMNPLGGRLQAIPAATLIECEKERGLRAVEVELVLPADAGQPAPAPTPPMPPATHGTPAPANGITWEAFTGHVQVQTANVRGGPTTADSVIRQVHSPQALAFDGFTYGPAEWDPVAKQMDRRWFHIDKAHGYGWIASAEIDGNPPNSHP